MFGKGICFFVRMLTLVGILLARDTVESPLTAQRILLIRFLTPIEEAGARHHIHPLSYDECIWNGILCEKGRVKKVEYRNLDIGNFEIQSLPPTVEYSIIVDCEQEYALQTRLLPRCLIHLNMCVNRLFGNFDAQHLPNGCIEILLKDNRLRGPIVLKGLPPNIRMLNLSGNDFVGETIYYGDLPEGIQKVLLKPKYNKKVTVSPISQTVRLSIERANEVFPFSKHR